MTREKQKRKNNGFNPLNRSKQEFQGSNTNNLKLVITRQPNFKVVLQ